MPRTALIQILTIRVVASAALPAQAETTRYVDATNCPSPGTGSLVDPFYEIQPANAASTNGDEVVSAGAYNELVNFYGKANARMICFNQSGFSSKKVGDVTS